MGQAEITSTEFPVEPLEDLYWAQGSKDMMAQAAVSQLVRSLVEYGVSPADIKFHLTEEAKKVN